MSQISGTPFLQGRRPGGEFLSGTQLADAVQSQPLQVFDVPATGAIQRSSLPNDMLEAFGLAGQVVAAAGNVAARDRAQEDQAQTGLAHQAFSLDGVDIADDIENGRVALPPGAKASEFATQFVDSLIETRYADRPEAWKNAYRANTSRIADALQDKRRRDIERGKKEAVTGFRDAAFRATDDAQLDAAIDGTKALGFDDRDAIASVIIPNLKAAAALGDADRYNRLASRVPDGMFAEDVAETKYRLEAAQLVQQSKQHQQADALLEGMLDHGVPLDTVREAVDALNRGDQLAPGQADKWRNLIDARAERNRREAVSAKADAVVQAVRTGSPYIEQLESLATSDPDVYDRILPQIQRAERDRVLESHYAAVQQRLTRGEPLAALQDEPLPLPSGGTVVAKASDTREAVISLELNRIMATTPPERRQIEAVVWSRDNGVHPRELKDGLAAGYFAAGRLMQGGQPSQATLDAMNLWKTVRENAPAWGKDLADAPTRRFFDASLDNMGAANGDPAVALRMALEAASVPTEERDARRVRLNSKMLERETRNNLGFDPDKSNYGIVANRIRAVAEAKADYGIPPEKAIADAIAEAKDAYVEINGAYIDTAVPGMTTDLKANLPAVTMDILTEYVGQSGRDPTTLTLEPIPGTGLWMVKDGNLPARDPKQKYTFETGALKTRLADMTAKRRAAGKAGITDAIMTREQRAEYNAAQERNSIILNLR